MRNPRAQARSLLVAGLLPALVFTIIEEIGGTAAGLVAGMVFGVGEILYEWRTRGRVDAITWGGNGLLLGLGGVSLLTQEGVFFKLQPSILEGAMALFLAGSCLLGRPFLWAMLQRQSLAPALPAERLRPAVTGMTWRMAAFLGLHAGVSAWAAFHWSTAAWAALKGVGFTVGFLVYGVAEGLVLRYRIASRK